MALNDTFAIYDVVDFFVQDYVTGDLLFTVDYAESFTLKTDAEKLEIKGGIGAPVRLTASHSRVASCETVLPFVDVNVLSTKLGRKVTRSAQIVRKSERLLVSADAKAALSQTPETGTLKVYAITDGNLGKELSAGTPGDKEDEYSISSKDITVNTALKGEYIRVVYAYETDTGTPLIRVTGKDFPGYIVIGGEGYGEDENGNRAPVAFTCYRAKPTAEFEMTFKTGEATNVSFNCDLSADLVNGEESVFFDVIPLVGEKWGGATLGGGDSE